MSKLITQIKRLALALCFVTPLVSWAATITDYEDFGDVAGVQLWRTATDSGVTDFAYAKFAAVAADGTVGETYTQNTAAATHWRRWASKYNNGDNSTYYTAPGLVLVYDQAGLMATPSSGATFAPVSFGGLWVKELGANDTPYGLTDAANKSRVTEFGATGYATLFKFEKSFTINRGAASTFYGTATVNITGDAVFTASTGYATVVDADATLKLTGDSTAAMSVGTGLTVNGTLDLSATTRPTISGNVSLVGTIVLPEGTEVSQENPFTVCSGTLSAANAYVKIGNADAALKRLTISGGAITALSDPVYEYTENYPTVVPAGQVFTFIGGDTAESATVASGVTVNGTLNTRGYISLSGLTTAKESILEVVDGTATVTASAAQSLTGDIKIDAGATMVNAMTADALNYGWGVYVHVYGTLDMGSTRWTVGSNARIHLYEGGGITGAGQESNGAIDMTSSNVRVIAHGDSTISANMRVRAENIPFEATEGKTLTISGLINDGVSYGEPGSITKQNSGTLVLTTAPTFTKALKLEAGTLELGGTAASSSVTVAASAATVAASSGSTLTGELIFVSHIPSAANKALIASEAFNGAVVLTGTISSAANITGLGNEVTLRDFTGFLDKSASTSGIKVKVEGTFTQSNGWSYDADRIYLAEIKGNGTMTQSGAQTQLYEVGSIANFTGTFNLTNARIKSNNNAVLDKAQKIATLTVAKTLTVNGGSLTGNLAANDIAVTVDGTPAVGDVLVPVTGTVSVSGTVTVNGDEVEVECVSGEGVKLAASTVTITVPTVANTTITVTVGGEPVAPATQGESSNTYSVADGATVTVTYTSDGYEVTGGTFEFTASEGYSVDTTGVKTTQYVASITFGETTKYTSLQAAVDAAASGRNIVLLASEEAGATVSREVTFTVTPGDYTYGTIVVDGDYILTTTVLEGKTRYSVAPAVIAVTINDVRTLYPPIAYLTGIAAANEGPIGTTVEILSGVPQDYVDRLPMFDLNTETGVFTKVADPVAAVYEGVIQQQVYRTLAEAVTAATSGQTVKLLADVDVVSTGLTFPADKTITFDLNGYTLTAGNGATSHVQVNGVVTITDSSEGAEGQIVSGENGTYGLVQVAENNTQEGAALTIAGGTIEAYFPDTLNSSQQHPAYGVTVKGKGTVFNMTGGKVKAGLMAVMGHGNKASAGTYTISGGTIESVDDFAMYLPTKGGCSVTISGGTFVGKGGICVRAGTLNVTGGTFTASGTGIAPGASAGTTGASFAGLSVWPNYGVIDVTISGGAFTSATGVDAVVSTESDYTASISLTGGAYSTDPSAYVAFGYKATETAGTWTVAKQPTTPPETPQVIDVDTTKTAEQQQADADAIAQDTVVTTPNADVAAAVSAETYDSYFTKTAVKENEQWTVQTALNEDVVFPTEDSDDLTADLADVLDVAAGADVEITTAKPGLYYSIEAAENVGFTSGKVEGVRELATTTTVSPAKPAKTGDAVFFRVKVSTTQE